MRFQKLFLMIVAFTIFSTTVLAQVTIGADHVPLEGALLQLAEQKPDANNTNSHKAFLYPRVFLDDTNLSNLVIDDNSKAKNYQGAMVFNTNPKLSEALYLWNGKEWRNIITTQKQQQDTKLVAYKESTGDADITYLAKGVDTELKSLAVDCDAERDGNLYISTTIYCNMYISVSKINTPKTDLSNTFFTVKVTDTTDPQQEPSEFYSATTAISAKASTFKNGGTFGGGAPLNSTSAVYANNNPATAYGLSSVKVKAGHHYQIRVFGQEGWNDTSTNPDENKDEGKAKIKAGPYIWGTYYAPSSIKVDYISDPY